MEFIWHIIRRKRIGRIKYRKRKKRCNVCEVGYLAHRFLTFCFFFNCSTYTIYHVTIIVCTYITNCNCCGREQESLPLKYFKQNLPGGERRASKSLVTITAVRGEAFEKSQLWSEDNFFLRTTSTLTQHDCRGILCMHISIHHPIRQSVRPTMHLSVWLSILSFVYASNDLSVHFSTYLFIYINPLIRSAESFI